MRQLEDRIAVVTGANRGIGREIAVAMAAAGAHVALVARERASLTATEDAVARHGADTLTVECDVISPDATAAMAKDVLDRFGRVDAVVASAGIAGPTTPMHEMPYEAWRECLATDLDGVFLTLRDFIPPMIQAGAGSLIAISSITGKRPLAGRTPYAAAKMGVIGLMRTLALELGPHGIRANSVCPGAVEGPRMRGVIAAQAARIGITPEEAAREFTYPAPLGSIRESIAAPLISNFEGQNCQISPLELTDDRGCGHELHNHRIGRRHQESPRLNLTPTPVRVGLPLGTA